MLDLVALELFIATFIESLCGLEYLETEMRASSWSFNDILQNKNCVKR